MFFVAMESVRPFTVMVHEVYEFLSSTSTTVTRRASKFLVSKEGAKAQFEFDLDNFPTEFFRALAEEQVAESQVELRLPGMSTDEAVWKETEAEDAWNSINPRWDGDFYDDDFHRALSYAKVMLRDPQQIAAVERIVDPILDRLAAVCAFAAEVAGDQERFFPKERTSWMGGEPYSSSVRQVLPRAHRVTEGSAAVLLRQVRLPNRDAPVPLIDAIQWIIRGFAESVNAWQDPDLPRADRDDWLARRLGQPFDEISPQSYLAYLEPLADSYRARLDKVATVVSTEFRDTTVERLLQFLALPFWRHRWYLYELWTVVLMLRTTRRCWPVELLGLHADVSGTVEWALPGGTARQPIAQLGHEGQVACWVQRKTYHPGTGEGLEPDLRLTTRLPPYHDILIVENKDRASIRRHTVREVLDRYVDGTCADVVWLVNYEAFPESAVILAEQWPGRYVRIASRFRPGEVPDDFEPSLLSALEPQLATNSETGLMTFESSDRGAGVAVGELTATLTWGQSPRDLDLHAWIIRDGELFHVYHSERGTLQASPFTQLDRDAQAGLGPETINLNDLSFSQLILAVHAYSDDGSLAQSSAALAVRMGDAEFIVRVPSGAGRWWHALAVGEGGLGIEVPNILSNEPPLGHQAE